jgi:hypothetical protein
MSVEWREESLFASGQPKWVPASDGIAARRQKDLEVRPVVERSARIHQKHQQRREDLEPLATGVNAHNPKEEAGRVVACPPDTNDGTMRFQSSRQSSASSSNKHRKYPPSPHETNSDLVAAALKRRMLALQQEKSHMVMYLEQARLLDTLFLQGR